jgi:hypothetical protein
MPTAASGSQLLLPQLKSRNNLKCSHLVLNSPRNVIKEEVHGISVTPRGENHWVAEKSRDLIETMGTPREFREDIGPRFVHFSPACCSESTNVK